MCRTQSECSACDVEWKIGVDSKALLASASVLSDSAQMSDVLVAPASRSLL